MITQGFSAHHEGEWKERPSTRGNRPRTQHRPSYPHATLGRVVAVDRGRYTVLVSNPSPRYVTAARARALHRTPIVVGDDVALVGDLEGQQGSLARLVRIEPRTTVLRRSADDAHPGENVIIANADTLVIVTAASHPAPSPRFLDRALVAAHHAGITPMLLVTKTDLQAPDKLLAYYSCVALTVITSRITDTGPTPSPEPSAVHHLRQLLVGRSSVFLGRSGVGKSTIVNALTGSQRDTQEVNSGTGLGRHTSSSTRALPLADAASGGWIIDTPGIRSFGLAHIDQSEVLAAFPDLAAADCPPQCSHASDEPQCRLDAWVALGKAGPQGTERLTSYRRLIEGVKPSSREASKNLRN